MRYLSGLMLVGTVVVSAAVGCGEETCPNAVCPCTEAGVRSAIASGGGPYTFDCDGPQTVVTEEEIVVRRSVILDGEGNFTLDGGDDHRVLSVPERVTAELRGFMITGGRIMLPEEPPLGEGGAAGVEERLDLGAGVHNAGTLTLTNSTVSGNRVTPGYHYGGGGAGIDNQGTLTLNGVTVSGNSCECSAGGIGSEGTLSMINSTVSGNAYHGIYSAGTLNLTSSTIFEPDRVAIEVGDGGLVIVKSTIVTGSCGAYSNAAIATFGSNIESPGDSCRFERLAGDQVDVTTGEVRLQPLADNGGPTQTHALVAGSVAIERGTCESLDGEALASDQRGVSRPQGDGCDSGAFEWEPPPATAACQPSGRVCYGADMVAPIEPVCEITVPDQEDACDGTESVANPTSCTASGNAVRYALTNMSTVGDCNAGYDLDDCYGRSCIAGGLASFDGIGGVDNGTSSVLASFPVLCDRVVTGPSSGRLDQAIHEAICAGDIDIEIAVDSVPEEGCAVVTLSAAGVSNDPIPMNLSDDGCLSGTVGTLFIRLGEVDGSLDNAVVRMTVSETGFSDGLLGGTMTDPITAAMAEEFCDGAGAIVGQFFDIDADLSGDVEEICSAVSMTFDIGGTAIVAESR